LQDRPDQIYLLYQKALLGYDIVLARRSNRRDSKLKKLYSHLFYQVFGYLTGTTQDASIANFGIYSSKAVDAILSMNDNVRYLPTMAQWVGFNSTTVDVQHSARVNGKTSYNFKRMLKLAINNIISFSDKPLRLVAQGGFALSFISLLVGIFFFVGYLIGVITIPGYASLIISIWFTAGINMFVLGLVGVYVGKAFEKIKDRPIFIVDEVLNND
jgi:dolichol-phosphate mannosyltransferase